MLAFGKFKTLEGRDPNDCPRRLCVRFGADWYAFADVKPTLSVWAAEQFLMRFVKDGNEACVVCGDYAIYLHPGRRRPRRTRGPITWPVGNFRLGLPPDLE